MRKNMVKSIEKLKKLMEDITETSRKLDVTQQVCHDFFKKEGKRINIQFNCLFRPWCLQRMEA